MHELTDFFLQGILSANMAIALSNKKLTSKEVARLLGVSEASVKRWADSGLLPAEKTLGGHRRFRSEDLATFRRGSAFNEKYVATKPESVSSSVKLKKRATSIGKKNALFEKIYAAILGGHSNEAAAMLIKCYLGGFGIAAVADDILCPIFRRVGELWCNGELSVAQEHIATQTGLSALRTLRSVIKEADRNVGVAICCSTEEDFHELPVCIAEMLLEENGWQVVQLGTNTPFYVLTEAVKRFKPDLICVASTILSGLDRAIREFEDFKRAAEKLNAAIVLGGAGFSGDGMKQRFHANLHAKKFVQLERFAQTVLA